MFVFRDCQKAICGAEGALGFEALVISLEYELFPDPSFGMFLSFLADVGSPCLWGDGIPSEEAPALPLKDKDPASQMW